MAEKLPNKKEETKKQETEEKDKDRHFRQKTELTEKENKTEEGNVERTSDFYRTENIPERFEYPACFRGYGTPQQQNPMYRTSSALYGSIAPNVHTVPVSFHPRAQKFTNHLGPCGMYRNRSLNTAMDKTII